MKHFILILEKLLMSPVLATAWFFCSIWQHILVGAHIASLDTEGKLKALEVWFDAFSIPNKPSQDVEPLVVELTPIIKQ
jgi:hypothetical protein